MVVDTLVVETDTEGSADNLEPSNVEVASS